ncbi:MAG: LLM class flavin-dependent oxidoreductase [Gammaproteobacteria bacterium]|nr:LLM class flavin-dependent oxidoreductase [Gammaproteobacteria bacterium]
MAIKLAVLDLVPIVEGGDAAQALANALDLAQRAEGWGFGRYWVAEHHNMRGIASAATAVVIGHIAGGTSAIRVGAGGVMLPNHAPLVIAEQFGTLESLHPRRIDLGIGRAPGTDQVTAHALRRTLAGDINEFPRDVMELRDYFAEAGPQRQVCAVPGEGLRVPLWILGSSLYGAQLAALLGLPYAFASHFAPAALDQALATYREHFVASPQLDAPYVMAAFNMFAADTEDEARLLRTSSQQSFLKLRTGNPGPLPPPKADFEATLGAAERHLLGQITACSAVGNPDQAHEQLRSFIQRTKADEVILSAHIYDHAARLRAYEIAAAIGADL